MIILFFIVIGLVVGLIAELIVYGRVSGQFIDMIVSITGALVGGYALEFLNLANYGFWGSIGMSTLGAVGFLFIMGLVTGFPSANKTMF